MNKYNCAKNDTEDLVFTKKLVQPPGRGDFLRTSGKEDWDGRRHV